MPLSRHAETAASSFKFLSNEEYKPFVKVSDCSQVSDGASAMLLVSEAGLAKLGKSEADVAEIVATKSSRSTDATVAQFIGDTESAQSVTVSGTEFEIRAKENFDSNMSATILIIGNETGGRVSIDLTVKKVAVSTVASRRVNRAR